MAVEQEQDLPQEDERDGEDRDTATATEAPVKPARQPSKPKPLPPYRVLLHNDDVNSFDWVIDAIVKLTPLKLYDALEKTFEAHDTGVSLLLTTHLERAELYRDQFATKKLKVTIEPAD